jgi:exonuclease III
MQQEPNQPPVNQPSQKSVDDKIAAVTNEVYTFEHTQKRSLLERFKALPRTRKILLLTSTAAVIFIAVMIGFTLALGGTHSGTNVATSGGGSSKDNLSEYEVSDVNGDGNIDQYDVAASDSSEGSSDTDQSDLSWWQKLISVSKSASSNTSDSSDYYSGDSVAFENDQSATGEDGASSNGGDLNYLDDTEISPDDNDFDSTDPIDILIADDPTTNTPMPAGGANITFASWNTLYSNSVGNVGKGVSAVGKKADIIGFQELHLSDRRKKMRDTLLCSSCAFSGYVQNYSTNGSNPGSVAIVWRKDRFKAVKSGYYKVSDTQHISTKTGSTGNKISAKWITWALLTDKTTGAQFYFLNTHTVASLESKGKPIGGEGDRVKNYTHHMDVLASKIKAFAATGLPVFITGDFNVNYRYDHKVQYKNFPFTRLGAVGAHSDYQRLDLAGIPKSQASQGGGNRIIDYVWYTNSSKVYPISESISTTRYGSDHSPVYFTTNVR